VAQGCEGKASGTRLVRLRDMEPGSKGRIARLSCGGKLRRRLMDMGVVVGTPVELVRFAPLGDPLELKFMGFHLSLRREEARDIWVEVRDQGAPPGAAMLRERHRTRRGRERRGAREKR